MTRLRCCVPHCRRTTARAEFAEWICGEHWRLVEKAKRRVYGRLKRRWRRYQHESDGARAARVWRRLRTIAIERALGIRG